MGYQDLRAVAQKDLSAFIEIALGADLWPKQKEIARAVSKPRARVVVPSCNSSGKTFLDARIALAFFWAFPEGRVISTSSTEDQLKDALWGEIRRAHSQCAVPLPGQLAPSDLWIKDNDIYRMVGIVARGKEGLQGRHAPQKLIIADEASSVSEETASGISGLLASGDARLLLTLNPTDTASWAYEQAQSPDTTVIQIRAWDTPLLAALPNDAILDRWGVKLEDSREPVNIPVPEGANLTEPAWLDELYQSGRGPGTPEWVTRVEARFWNESNTQLIVPDHISKAKAVPPRPGRKTMGVDLAPYGTDENVIAYRRGNTLVKIEAFPSMRMDIFWSSIVKPRVKAFEPDTLIYDADGVGAGVIGETERAVYGTQTQLLPFRGASKINNTHLNQRSTWWWRLRQQFENENIRLQVTDTKLEEQLTQLKYDFSESGKIRVWSKEKMRKQGIQSPDRADAMMYAFAIDPPEPKVLPPHPDSETAMWLKDMRELDEKSANSAKSEDPIDPTTGSRQWF